MKFCFVGIKKFRIRFMNLVFFMTSSKREGVRRFPSRISLITGLKFVILKTLALPVPSLVFLLLKHTALLDLEVELLVIYLLIVVGLQIDEVVRNNCVEGETQLH